MGIRDQLAAEGNAPLVFMGGTCAGPKWRERLCAQVAQPFRWFNPVVDEWTEEAKETELTVREEADVMLYAITPYQEGCYSYLEMTEDAVRSEKPVVIAFLPSFEDKAFSEQQWSSIVSAKRLLERNNATVLLSMEETIEWFNRYAVGNPDSKLLDTAELLRKANNAEENKPAEGEPPATKGEPVTAAGLVNAVQQDRAQQFTKPTPSEPGTAPAVSEAGQPTNVATESYDDAELSVSTEGIFDGLVGFIRGYADEDSPGDTTSEGKEIHDFSWARDQKAAIDRTFGNEKWVRANFKEKATLPTSLLPRLARDGKILKPVEGFNSGVDLVTSEINKLVPALESYQMQLRELEELASKRVGNGEDGDVVAKDILSRVSKLTMPIKQNYTTSELPGGFVLRFSDKTDNIGKMTIQINPKGQLVAPELTVEDVIEAGKLLSTFGQVFNKLLNLTPFTGSGCDDGVWTEDNSGFDYESTYGEELYEHFYFQDIPGKYSGFADESVFLFATYVRSLGRWLQACTR